MRLHLAGVGFMLLASLAGALAPVALRLSSDSPGVTAAVKLGTYFGGCCNPSLGAPPRGRPATRPGLRIHAAGGGAVGRAVMTPHFRAAAASFPQGLAPSWPLR